MMPEANRKFETRSTNIKIPITPRSLPALIRAGWEFRKGFRAQDLNAESPKFVMFDQRSSAILKRAGRFAADGREDQEAVAELKALAGRHRRALRLAALGARQWGRHRELSVRNLAHRLLQSAVTGKPVEPVGALEREQLAALDHFVELARDDAWQTLTAREPQLRKLEADARAGRFGRFADVSVIDDTMTTEDKQQLAREGLKGMMELDERLKPLVGPESGRDDILLGSHIALESARSHILLCTRPVGAADD
jgi:hypothetical protein